MTFERFTNKAKTALNLAETSARELGHRYIGTEHLLLGLVREGTGTAAKVLEKFGVTEEKVTELIRQIMAPVGSVATAEKDGYTPKAGRVLEQSILEAEHYRAGLAGTEHILISLLKEGECVATRLLNTLGVSIQRLYVEVLVSMGEDYPNRQLQ